jgi:hypothetical protein
MVDTSSDAADRGWATWQRRLIEVMVSVLAFAVWGKLAYVGGYRLWARAQDWAIGGHVMLDIASLFIGVAGSIAGVMALWAIGMRAIGRTPKSMIGTPDDTPEDYPTYMRSDEHSADEDIVVDGAADVDPADENSATR